MIPDSDIIDFPEVRIWANTKDDLEKVRISYKNRIDRAPVDVVRFMDNLEHVLKAEHFAEKGLEWAVKRVADADPSIAAALDWAERTKGVGLPSVYRLLGRIGHPRWMVRQERQDLSTNILTVHPPEPRSIAQLRSYCGVGDPLRKPRKGMSQKELLQMGDRRARSRLFVMSVQQVKGGYYRPLYYSEKARTADQVHVTECKNTKRRREDKNGCGTSTDPGAGAIGSPWTDGHRHASAMRVVGKAILKDLWLAADPSATSPAQQHLEALQQDLDDMRYGVERLDETVCGYGDATTTGDATTAMRFGRAERLGVPVDVLPSREERLPAAYLAEYGSTMADDNDRFGRAHVLKNAIELVYERSG